MPSPHGTKRQMTTPRATVDLRAEVVAALLEREEDRRQLYTGEARGSEFGNLSSSSSVQGSPGYIRNLGHSLGIFGSSPSDSSQSNSEAIDDASVQKRSATTTTTVSKPTFRLVERRGGAVLETKRGEEEEEEAQSGAMTNTPASSTVARAKKQTSSAHRRFSAPVSLQLEELASASQRENHQQVVVVDEEKLEFLATIQKQWEERIDYHLALQEFDTRFRNTVGNSLQAWQEYASIKKKRDTPRFSKKWHQKRLRTRLYYGEESSTVLWRLNAWRWRAKFSHTQRLLAATMASRVRSRMLASYLVGWCMVARANILRGRQERRRTCTLSLSLIRAWRASSSKNLSRALSLEWLLEHRVKVKQRRIFDAWRTMTALDNSRRALILPWIARAFGRDPAGISMRIFVAWKKHVVHQSKLGNMLSIRRNLRNIRMLRSAFASWSTTIKKSNLEQTSLQHKLLQLEFQTVVRSINEKSRDLAEQQSLWAEERQSWEDRSHAMKISIDSLQGDNQRQSTLIKELGAREETLSTQLQTTIDREKQYFDLKDAQDATLAEAIEHSEKLDEKLVRYERENAQYKTLEAELNLQIHTLEGKLEQMTQDKSTFTTQMKEYVEQMDEKNKMYVAAASNAEQLTVESARLTSLLEKYTADETKWKVEKEAYEKTGEDARAKDIENLEKIDALNGEAVELRNTISSGNRREEERREEIARLQERIAKMDEEEENRSREIEGLLTLLKAKSSDILSRDDSIERLEASLKRETERREEESARAQDGEERCKSLLITIVELKETVLTLKNDSRLRDVAEKNVVDVAARLKEIQTKLQLREDEIFKIKSDYEEKEATLKREVFDLTSALESLKAKLDMGEATRKENEVSHLSTVQSLKEEVKQSQLGQAKATQLSDGYQKELMASKRELDIVLEDRNALKVQAGDLAEQLDSLRSRASKSEVGLKEDLADARNDLTLKSAEIKRLTALNENVSKASDQHRDAELQVSLALKALESKCAILEEEKSIALSNLEAEKKQMEDFLVDLRKRETAVVEAQSVQKANKATIENLQTRLLDVVESHRQYELDVGTEKASLQSRIKTLSKSETAKQEEIAELRESVRLKDDLLGAKSLPSVVNQLQTSLKEKETLILQLRQELARTEDEMSEGVGSTGGHVDDLEE